VKCKRGESQGFTLIEVMVALAIASGALVLILSANHSSLRRSEEAMADLRLTRALDSQLEACLSGSEPALQGELEGFPGWRWEVFRTPGLVGELRSLRRVVLGVYRPGGQKAAEWTVFQQGERP
jgi:prepilin-type N-terminal cleavage/methylation domain-containing protein